MATTNKQLQADLEALKQLLAEHGIRPPRTAAQKPEDRSDHIAHGSPEHAIFLGLVEVEGEDDPLAVGCLTHTSLNTGKMYKLEDEVTQFMMFPDPRQVAALVLRQKVSVFEAGKPPIYEGAPSLQTMGLFPA